MKRRTITVNGEILEEGMVMNHEPDGLRMIGTCFGMISEVQSCAKKYAAVDQISYRYFTFTSIRGNDLIHVVRIFTKENS